MNRFVYIVFLITVWRSPAASGQTDTGAAAIPFSADSLKSTVRIDSVPPESPQESDSPLSIDSSSQEVQSEDSLAAMEENADTAVLPQASPSDTTPRLAAPRLYFPGISQSQDSMARALIRYVWLFSWDEAEKTGKKMQKLERKEHLPPLSALMMTSAYIIQLQNGGFPSERTEKNCLEELDEIAQRGLELSDPSRAPDSLLATRLLIYGGLKGLLSTLHLGSSPIAAAVEGLNALTLLEKCVALDSAVNDAYLGLGIFYCALAKASPVVRGALKLIGRTVSLEKGLEYLRRSAYHGRYTCDMAKLYLVEFLTPYQREQADEKRRILASLKSAYPANPYFLFLDLEENLCFHPEKALDPATRRAVRKKINSFTDHDYSRKRFAALVQWQYIFIDPLAAANLGPDTTFNVREFSYYPTFLSALREKYIIRQSPEASAAIRERQTRFIKRNETLALKMLHASAMSSGWKGFYLWHIRDALKMQ